MFVLKLYFFPFFSRPYLFLDSIHTQINIINITKMCTVETQVLVWSPKLSNVKPVMTWTFGNARCCKLGSASGAMENSSHLVIRKLSSNCRCVSYVYYIVICANAIRKGMKHHLSQLWVN